MTDMGTYRRAVNLLAAECMDLQVAGVLVRMMYRQRLATLEFNADAVARLVRDWCRVDGVNAHVSEVRVAQSEGRKPVSDVYRAVAR